MLHIHVSYMCINTENYSRSIIRVLTIHLRTSSIVIVIALLLYKTGMTKSFVCDYNTHDSFLQCFVDNLKRTLWNFKNVLGNCLFGTVLVSTTCLNGLLHHNMLSVVNGLAFKN